MANSLSASISVRRIVKGDTLSLYFEQSGLALFQGFDPSTGTAIPAWTASSYPCLTPKVGSARGQGVTLAEHKWSYNGADLKFKATGSGWETSSVNAKFQMNHDDGSLRIVGNLASKDNQDADTLTYSGTAFVGSSSYPLSKTVDVQVCPVGSSSYVGGIMASSAHLDSTTTTSTLSTTLYNANGAVTGYTVDWYKDDELWKSGTTSNVSVGRDDVDSQQLFIAVFKVDGQEVCRAGISIIDTADEYKLDLYHKGTDQGVDETHSDTIAAKIYRTKDMQDLTGTAKNVTYKWTIYKSSDFSKTIRTSTESTLTVANSDTSDKNGGVFDVTVNCDVTFEL